MVIHIVEGESGCQETVEREAIAVVVDAMRTSATLPWMFERGAREILVVSGLSEVHALREDHPDALLAGEFGGARITGFDLGNSPHELKSMESAGLKDRVVIFSSSAGSRRLVQAGKAPEVYVGSPVNARRVAVHVARRAAETGRDVALIAAGHPERGVATPEDYWAATYLASILPLELSPAARQIYDKYIDDLISGGLGKLYRTSPSAKRLQKLGFEDDVPLCSAVNTCRSVPTAAGCFEVPGGGAGVTLRPLDMADYWLHASMV
ncbi:2-phosphosulfolactate phosphatase [Planctomycetota bacterium]